MRIARYLLSTRDKGIICKPDYNKGLEIFVDADFAGGYDPKNSTDADTMYSRTGFVIKHANCPVYWQSKLQTKISLSTAEAEYIALSSALRETIPLNNLITELQTVMPVKASHPHFVVRFHEDNQSCIAIAENPKFTPRTKHIALKYHHFRKHVRTKNNKDGFLEIFYCPTTEQVADIFTKPISQGAFEYLRKLLMGW